LKTRGLNELRSVAIWFFILMLVVFQFIAYIAYILSPDRLVLSDPGFVFRAIMALATSIGIAVVVFISGKFTSTFVENLARLRLEVVYMLVAVIVLSLVAVLFVGDVRFGARRWLFFFQVSDLIKVLVVIVAVPLLGKRSEVRGVVSKPPLLTLVLAGGFFIATVVCAVLSVLSGQFVFPVLMILSAVGVFVSGVIIEFKAGYINRAGFLVLMAIVAVLTLFEPDIGTAVLFTLWTVSMVAIWGGKRGMMYFLTFVVVIVALLLTLALHPDLVKSASVPSVFRHALARIEAWLNPLADPYGVTYQAVKDYRAVYLGGLIGHKVLPYDVPPVPWADTIIPFVVLYLGAIAGYVVLVVLITYALSLLWISKNLTIGSSIFVSGYALLLLWQTIVSSLSSFNILPQTGMSVPYLSWGRTALITFTILGAMALAAAVWQTSNGTEGGEKS